MELRIKRLDKGIDVPEYKKEDDAAFDLRAAEELTIPAGEKRLVRTGLCIEIPRGYAGLVWDRSGIAAKHGVHSMAGVIDSGYRGEISVVLHNLSDQHFSIDKNMRIAQMLIQPVAFAKIIEVDELSESDRGDGGFGSTGVK